MRTTKFFAIAAVLAVLAVAGCGGTAGTPHHHAAAPATFRPYTENAGTPSPSPVCDITGWENASPGTGPVGADLTAMSNDLQAGASLPVIGADAVRLSRDATAAEHPRPPACAPVLRKAWRLMMGYYDVSGAYAVLAVAKPWEVGREAALGRRVLRHGLREQRIVQAQETALGG